MGAFYTNLTMKGPSQEEILKAFRGRQAYISPTVDGNTVVYDEQCEEQSPAVLTDLSSKLSKELNCLVLIVLNHDDDILFYRLYNKGELVDEYCSSPENFEETDEPSGPKGGNSELLTNLFKAGNKSSIEEILRSNPFVEDKYAFATERHADLVKALGLPAWAVGYGYAYIAQGEIPGGLTENQLKVLSADNAEE